MMSKFYGKTYHYKAFILGVRKAKFNDLFIVGFFYPSDGDCCKMLRFSEDPDELQRDLDELAADKRLVEVQS